MKSGSNLVSWVVTLGLVALCLVVFQPVLGFDFVELDDPLNFQLSTGWRGLGANQFKWMFLQLHGYSAYDPIAWVTFALDYSLFELDPQRYHLTNLVYYVLCIAAFNRVVLSMLARFSAAEGRVEIRGAHILAAFLASALFALHPLRAETAAWLSERHGILAVLFSLLCVLAYLRFVDLRREGRPIGIAYSICLVCFVLAVGSKSTVLFLPLGLLVLDFHPLGRMNLDNYRRRFYPLLAEKFPLIAVSLLSGYVTILARRSDGLWSNLADFGLIERFMQACYGFWFYLLKTVAPVGLSPIYLRMEYRDGHTGLFVLATVAFLALLALAITQLRTRPWLAAGIAWNVLMMLPVSGLVTSGPLVAADRYSFAAMAPWFVMLAFPIARLLDTRLPEQWMKIATVAGIGAVVLASSALTRTQLAIWRDSDALWDHVVSGSDIPGIMLYNRGAILFQLKNPNAAIPPLKAAAEIRPEDPNIQLYLGDSYSLLMDTENALAAYSRVIEIDPDHYVALVERAKIYRNEDRSEELVADLERAIEVNPDGSEAMLSLSRYLVGDGRPKESIALLDGYLERNPDDLWARYQRALSHFLLRELDAATSDLQYILAHPGEGVPKIDRLRDGSNGLLMAIQKG